MGCTHSKDACLKDKYLYTCDFCHKKINQGDIIDDLIHKNTNNIFHKSCWNKLKKK